MSTLVQPSSIAEIDLLAKNYAKARSLLSDRVTALNDELRTVHGRRIGGIRSALADAADAKALLVASIDGNRHLFVKPRTMTLNGVKVGLGKGAGRVEWDDDESVLARIDKLLARDELTEEQYDLIVKEQRELSSTGLRELDVKILQRLGVTVEATGDAVIVKTEDGAVDKLVKRLVKEGAQQTEESKG